jgi:hypothetical protein
MIVGILLTSMRFAFFRILTRELIYQMYGIRRIGHAFKVGQITQITVVHSGPI